MTSIFEGKMKIEGFASIENLVVIDQAPIGRTSRSTPATYLGIFDEIRDFLQACLKVIFVAIMLADLALMLLKVAARIARGWDSYCLYAFLADVTMICIVCKGQRYNTQTLEITYKDKNIFSNS